MFTSPLVPMVPIYGAFGAVLAPLKFNLLPDTFAGISIAIYAVNAHFRSNCTSYIYTNFRTELLHPKPHI